LTPLPCFNLVNRGSKMSLIKGETSTYIVRPVRVTNTGSVAVSPEGIPGFDQTLDRLVTTHNYTWTKLTASALVFGAAGVDTPGTYVGMIVTGVGTGGTIAVYDSNAADGTGTELPAPAVVANASLLFHAKVTTGLAVVLGGSTAPTVWVAYEVG